MLGPRKVCSRADRVIAQVIDRFADLGERCRDRAPALADDERHQPGSVALVELGRMFENCRPYVGRCAIPGRSATHRPRDCPLDVRRPCGDNLADLPAPITRIEDRFGGTCLLDTADDRRRPPRAELRLR